ncbi:GNAT family N-acetyltransferase [uncultured Ruegeria sp.]|uniref:GNAT family N-acetyltransferase n=1 Tax=uncultured Ruegeria sp. TaxID=259304 RepID=UPI0026316E8B|nr:GNAT family N-acetyltransferase [uncultured Ruegeria sp.]
MSELTVSRYEPSQAADWNAFVANSRNGTFLHDRRFMDYHADRFIDASLIVERSGKIIAVVPANRDGDKVVSHGGLTYGGMIAGKAMRTDLMLETFDALTDHLRCSKVAQFIYKPTPHFYHNAPLEEDLYALSRFGGRLLQTDASAAIPIPRRPKESQSRRQGAKRAAQAGITVTESQDWAAFWCILTGVLAERHNTTPTHSLAEIEGLVRAFPGRIRLFSALQDGHMLGGVVCFDCGRCIHVQYIAVGPGGREDGALDAIILHLIQDVFADRDWLDFGISTTDGGRNLNTGLAQQKEMFGARCVVYQRYIIDL